MSLRAREYTNVVRVRQVSVLGREEREIWGTGKSGRSGTRFTVSMAINVDA